LKEENKTKKQLIRELIELRQKITELLNTDPEQRGIHSLTNEYEIRYRTLFDRSLFCAYLHDLQGNLFDANETALKLFGYTKEELPSLNILSLIPEEQRPVALQRIEEIFKSGAQKKPFEYLVKKKDGEYLWLEVEGALIMKHGRPYAIQGIARDITERRKAEEELLRIHHEWENIFHAIGHPTIILDEQHNILSANRATVKAVGADSQEELLGKKCYEIFHNASEPPKSCPLVKMLTSTKFEESEMEVEALGGVFLVSCTPVFDKKGNVQKIIHIATDITKRKRAEESLHASEERFRALTENTSDWIWEVDQSFVFTYTSPKVKDLLGYEPNEIIGKTPFDLMPNDEARRTSEISHSILASRKPFTSLENINLHKDGHQVIIETSGVPIFDKNGNFVGYRGIDRDVTERKLLEEGIRESEGKYRSLYQEFRGILDAIPDALVLLSSDLKVVWSNEVAAKNMNMSLDDFIGQHCYKVRHGRSEPCKMCPVLECFTSHKPKIIESSTSDGRIWELHVYPVFGDRGEVKGVIEAAHNITERKRAEEALKQHRKELIERINELEEFYNLAVGRELRMVELKKEIEQLKQLLEKYQIPLPKKTTSIR
jgi:PAS domain S-box-containing protein